MKTDESTLNRFFYFFGLKRDGIDGCYCDFVMVVVTSVVVLVVISAVVPVVTGADYSRSDLGKRWM